MKFIDKEGKKHEANVIREIPNRLIREYLIDDLQEGDLIYSQPIYDFIKENNINVRPDSNILMVNVSDFGTHSLVYLAKDWSNKWRSFETTSPLQKDGELSSY